MSSHIILLLGEGNFSFACNLATKLTWTTLSTLGSPRIDLIASDLLTCKDSLCAKSNCDNLKTDNAIALKLYDHDQSICDNIQTLDALKVPIWLDVDSTKLEHNVRLIETLSTGKYEQMSIVFNFPHVHNIKMKINLNRDLIRSTFRSAEALFDKFPNMKNLSKVFISLCPGQSGLNEVEPEDKHRSWCDSWQLTEMAENFILTNVFPFGFDLIDALLNENDEKTLERQFEHNAKCYVDANSVSSGTVPREGPAMLNHQPFGYRLQNRPFNHATGESQFRGGNVFTFELRADILQTLDQEKCDLFQIPIINEFIKELCELLESNYQTVLFSKQKVCSEYQVENFLVIQSVPSNIENLICDIQNYLEKDEKLFFLKNDRLLFQDLEYGNVTSKQLSLHIENCFKVRWKIKNTRILYSEYLTKMTRNATNSTLQESILTTKLLYSRVFNRDVSFWIEKAKELNIDVQEEFKKISFKVLGPSLVAIILKDHFIKSTTTSSYCFGLQIQSLDRNLNRWKVAQMLTRLQERLCEELPNVSSR